MSTIDLDSVLMAVIRADAARREAVSIAIKTLDAMGIPINKGRCFYLEGSDRALRVVAQNDFEVVPANRAALHQDPQP